MTKGCISKTENDNKDVRLSTQIENIALLSSEWEIEFKNQNGDVEYLKGMGSEIVRKQNDGTWLFIIYNPTSGNNVAFV